MKTRCLGAAIGVMLAGAALSAQTTICETSCEVRVNQPFVVFTDTSTSGWNYQLYVNGQPSGIAPTFTGDYVEFAHPGFSTPGSLTVSIRAETATGPVEWTDTMSLSVTRRKVKIRW